MEYKDLVSPENLFIAFDEFKRGKRKKKDVMEFERNLEWNIFELSQDLLSKTYKHGPYHTFFVHDPKFRIINKASVGDRIVHHALFQYLYRLFDKTFIFHSYSSRIDKGTHIAVKNLHRKMRKVSRNFTKNAYALKCDIRQFFANIDHQILLRLISKKVNDPDILWLTGKIINSYQTPITERERERVTRLWKQNVEYPLAT